MLTYFTNISVYPDIKVTYKTYWMQVKSLNISFAKLGLEQCETCLIYDVYMDRSVENIMKNSVDYIVGRLLNQVECNIDGCEVCLDFKDHIGRVDKCRKEVY